VVVAQQFPYEIYRKLEGVDFRLIDELSFLANLQAQRTGSRYCIPGRKYLARKLGVCVRTISRHLSKLRRLGVIDAIQRRPVRGQFQTNLYRVYEWTVWQARRVMSLIRDVWEAVKPKKRAPAPAPTLLPDRGTPLAHLAPKKERITPPETNILETNPLLREWMKRGEGG